VKIAIAVLMVITGLLPGCSKKQEAVVKPPVAVELATAATAELTEGIEVTGNLEPKFSADVKTQIPGLVKEVYVTQWVRVVVPVMYTCLDDFSLWLKRNWKGEH
jgi:multidrug efflux pump subunit AcrA (membrane-fusion protein)